MLGRVLLGLSGSERMRNLVERAPISRGIVARFIAGDETADAVRAAADLASAGLTLANCPRAELTTVPRVDPFKRGADRPPVSG